MREGDLGFDGVWEGALGGVQDGAKGSAMSRYVLLQGLNLVD